ncbi:MAG: AraC family transcriptional regulator [Polyangiales bacterium]
MNGEDASLRPVARAIERMVTAGPSGLSLTALAEEAGLSAGHFQRLFKRGVGVSPKRFQQALALVEARRLLDDDRTVLDAALAAGLSGPGRLHDLFVACEGMTPGEWRRGEGVTVRHGLSESPFGIALVGWTDVGVCWLSLGSERELDAMRGGFGRRGRGDEGGRAGGAGGGAQGLRLRGGREGRSVHARRAGDGTFR